MSAANIRSILMHMMWRDHGESEDRLLGTFPQMATAPGQDAPYGGNSRAVAGPAGGFAARVEARPDGRIV